MTISHHPLQITEEIQLPLNLGTLHTKWTFVVLTNILSTVVLGVDFIRENDKKCWMLVKHTCPTTIFRHSCWKRVGGRVDTGAQFLGPYRYLYHAYRMTERN